MTEFNNIPEHDADLKLSRQYRDNPNKVESEVPLIRLLQKARDAQIRQESEIPVRGQEVVWDRIHSGMTQNPAGQSNVISMRPVTKWLIAAAIAIFALTSIFLYQQQFMAEPALIADAGSSISVIELADGSRVTLRPNSQLFQNSADQNGFFYTLSGEALFEVKSSPEKIFAVDAGPGRVTVTGTTFNLSGRSGQSSVHLIEGNVRFETAEGDQYIQLIAGEGAIIDSSQQLSESFTFEADEITGWTQNRIWFRNRDAGSVISEIEFHFNITISAPTNVKSEILGGSVPIENQEETLEYLGHVLDGIFVLTGPDTYEFQQD